MCLPTLVAGADILNDELKVVLPSYQLSSFSLSAVYAATSRQSLKLKLFVEHIAGAFSRVPPDRLRVFPRDCSASPNNPVASESLPAGGFSA